MPVVYLVITLWLFNIAMENGPFIDGLPIKNGDLQPDGMCFATDISINGWIVLWVHGFVVQCDEGKFLFEVADGRGAPNGGFGFWSLIRRILDIRVKQHMFFFF